MGYIPAYLRWLLQAIAHGFCRDGEGGVKWNMIGEEVESLGSHINYQPEGSASSPLGL